MEQLFFETSSWFILICLFIAFAYAFVLYFRDSKLEVSKTKKYIFASIRFLSTFIITLLLLNPFFQKITIKIEQPKIIFAIDNTKSVKLIYKDSSEFISQKLHKTIDDISDIYKLENISFDKNINDSFNIDFNGLTTNITNTLQQINDENYNQNIGALILVSDGIYNSGIDPAYFADVFPFSIYSVGVGDTISYSDIEIKSFTTNQYVFLNDEFPVEVRIYAEKLKNQTFTINISNGKQTLITDNVQITDDNFVFRKIYYIKADKEGLAQYICNVTKFKTEHNHFNNTKILTVNVLKNKQKILFLANNISPDIAAFKRAIDKNKNFSVDVQMINGFNNKISDSISMIVFYNLPSSSDNIKEILNIAKSKKIPLIFILGTQTDYLMLNSFNLGYTSNIGKVLFDEVHGEVNKEFQTFKIDDKLNQVLKFSPPMTTLFSSPKISPGLEVVLYQTVSGLKTNRPLVLVSDKKEFYPANYAIIAAENFWAVRMYDYKINGTTDIFDNFLMQIVQFVGVRQPKKNLIVKVNNTNVQGEEIIFKAEVYDHVYQLVNDVDVNLNIKDSSGNVYHYLFSKTDNAYEINVGSFSEGKYSYTASTELDKKSISESGVFYILKSDLESQNLQANFNLLKKLSVKTGGKFLTFKNIDSLKTYLENDPNIVPVSYSSKSIVDVGDFKWLFFLILALLALEWSLRKFYGTY